jgi:rRNA maturation endonuclease Nob1
MDGPKSAVAVWAADYTQLYLIAGVIALFVAGTVVVPVFRRWRRQMASSVKKPKEPSKVCSICGGRAALIPNIQRYYCPNCKRYV